MQAIANYYLILMLKHFKDAVQVYKIIKAGILAQCVAAIMQNNLDFSGGNSLWKGFSHADIIPIDLDDKSKLLLAAGLLPCCSCANFSWNSSMAEII